MVGDESRARTGTAPNQGTRKTEGDNEHVADGGVAAGDPPEDPDLEETPPKPGDGSIDAGPDGGDGAGANEDIDFDDEKLLDGISLPVFTLTRSGSVIAWNASMERLTGVERDEMTAVEDVHEAFGLGPHESTLAEEVLDAPDDAHEMGEVTLEDENLGIFGAERQLTLGSAGKVHHCEFSARPLYKDGDLAAVMQIVQDRTVEVRRDEAIEGFVTELGETLGRLADGDLSARAEFHDEHGVIAEDLLAVVDDVNEMAEGMESLVTRVDDGTREMAGLVDQASGATERIDRQVTEQSDLLGNVVAEIQTFSATMEQVAANSEQVATAAGEAQSAAERGLEASGDAHEATDEVLATSQDLVGSVQDLESEMNEIEEVVEVINDVADQTNMLALNASIEAARAGEAGAGFAVVADEIKELADETSRYTDEIFERIDSLQDRTAETVTVAEESNAQVTDASDDIQEALDALEEIAESVDEAAQGITEIADANDGQADNIQEVRDLVEQADDQTDAVREAAADIVDATDDQERAIDDLTDRVSELQD